MIATQDFFAPFTLLLYLIILDFATLFDNFFSLFLFFFIPLQYRFLRACRAWLRCRFLWGRGAYTVIQSPATAEPRTTGRTVTAFLSSYILFKYLFLTVCSCLVLVIL